MEGFLSSFRDKQFSSATFATEPNTQVKQLKRSTLQVTRGGVPREGDGVYTVSAWCGYPGSGKGSRDRMGRC